MEKVKRFFKEIRWFEYLFLAVCLAILIALCVVYKSSVPTALSSTLGVVSVFFITKGNVVGQIIGLVQLPFYAYISYVNKLYGEMIICFLISFPLYIIAVISWLRNLNSKGAVGSVKVNIDLSLKEWLIVLVVGAIFGVGVYFLLGYFNTNQLILSTLSVLFSSIACYIVMRRSSYGFIFYIINNIACIIMWVLIVVNDNNFSQVATFVNCIMYIVINILGLFNFAKLKKEQDDDSFDKILRIVKEDY